MDVALLASPVAVPLPDGIELPSRIEIHLAMLDVDPAQREKCEALLTPEERQRAARLHFQSHADRFVVRRGKLRMLLSDRLGCDAREVRLCCNNFGKPGVRGTELRFNLSHSGGVALYVFVRNTEIGCDIEWRRPDLAREEVAKQFFSDREVQALRAVPRSRWIEAFFNCWTRKEALIKALGLGLSYPLKAFDVSLAPGEPAALLRGPVGWSLYAFEPLAGLQAAIALRHP